MVLIGAAFLPGRASGVAGGRCPGPDCHRHVRVIQWAQPLPGSWAAAGGSSGTVLSPGEAYAAAGSGLAAVGFGTTVAAYGLITGHPLWTAQLTGFPAGSAVVSVRAWPGVVTAGVSVPPASAATGAGVAGHREEVVLSARTGRAIASYRAAAYGGAVAASLARTVIVGTSAVTSYGTASGRVIWRRGTGSVPQAWQVDGADLLVTVGRGGYLGSSPVTALRRISLRTGAQKLVRPAAASSFAGSLRDAIGNVAVFSGSLGVSAYSQADGRLLWRRPDVVPETVDPVLGTLYVANGRDLIGIDPETGKTVSRAATPGAADLYEVTNGVALGLDQGALGDAWGYDLARDRVIWTSKAVPWPHYFVDLSGIGGSADPVGGTILLASCGRVGVAASSGTPPPCLQPRLVALRG